MNNALVSGVKSLPRRPFNLHLVVNRGGNFSIFSDPALACKWLGMEESAVVVK
jgi:lipoprotein signal peptidase